MNRNYCFCFPVGHKIVISFESATTLLNRTEKFSQNDRDMLKAFINVNRVGHFVQLEGGELVFQTS